MKNKLKSLLCIALAGMMLITLAGCGKKEEKKEDDNNQKSIELGKWTDNTYENKELDIKFTLPGGWEASTDYELAEEMKVENLLSDEEKYLSEVSKLSIVYYVMAKEAITGNNLVIMSETGTMSLEQYLTNTKEVLQQAEQMSYELVNEGTETIGSKTYSTILMKENTYGVEQKHYIRKEGDKFIIILMTSVNGEETFTELAKNIE